MISYDDDYEALTIANDTRYGLAAGVWTMDQLHFKADVRDLKDLRSIGGTNPLPIGAESLGPAMPRAGIIGL
jgi:acyl-CoA reductase-like NAD-dependent aldehyde dehydrogenase